MKYLVILSLGMIRCQGWSGDSHRVIARIASQFLRESGKNYIAEHLTGQDASVVEKSLIEHSTYADSVEWSSDLHFSHTPYRACSPFDMKRDCQMVDGTHRCIVTAIANYTMRASNVELTSEDRAEAIKFLIHLIGDIHNPVHVGFAEDFGGNLIHLSDPAGKSLHDVWDFSLVNRKQVEHGVYKEMEGDEAEPWKLSDALLEQFTEKQSLYPFMLNVKLEDVSSEESATRLAAGMASRTARDFTCNVAYRNENDQWIESGDSLSDEYMSSRSLHAMEMLKLAGIRLAEMINMISRQYSMNKRAAASVTMKVNHPGSYPAQDANRYTVLVLDIDFDPEKLLFEENTGIEKVDTGVTLVETKDDAVAVETSMLTKTLSKSQKKKMRKARSKRLFEGVDLEEVVLIKRSALYIVTGSDLVTPEYFPTGTHSYKVRFSGKNEVVFTFDIAHFGKKDYSEELIKRSLMKIRNTAISDIEARSPFPLPSSNTDEDNGSLSFERVYNNVALLSAQYHVGGEPSGIGFTSNCEEACKEFAESMFENLEQRGSSSAKKKAKKLRKKENKQWMDVLGHVPSPRELLEFAIRKSFNSICLINVGKIVFFAHKNTLEDKTTPMIKANMHNVVSPVDGGKMIMLIDMLIFEGEFSHRLVDILIEASTVNFESCESSIAKRPTIDEELDDIQTLLLKKEEDRAKNFRRIKDIRVLPAGVDAGYCLIHWSIRHELVG